MHAMDLYIFFFSLSLSLCSTLEATSDIGQGPRSFVMVRDGFAGFVEGLPCFTAQLVLFVLVLKYTCDRRQLARPTRDIPYTEVISNCTQSEIPAFICHASNPIQLAISHNCPRSRDFFYLNSRQRSAH